MKCPRCADYCWIGRHECPPEWEVIRPEYHDEDDPMSTFGVDAEGAAIKFAKDNFSRWDSPDEMEIWVRRLGEADWIKFDISVEPVPAFYASRKVES